MNIAPRYLGRGSWLSRRDPRLLLVGLALFVFTVIQVWDLRILAGLAIVAALYYRSAGIPFRAVRIQWAYVLFFISFVVIVNTLLTGGELRGLAEDELHIYFRLPLLGTPISAESVTYAIVQYLRFLSMAAVGLPIAYAIAPGDIGPAFARLGVPYKFAYGMELTFRFVPSLAGDLQTTIDAQRVRGYEWEKRGRTPIGKLTRTIPMVTPVTINAIVGAEDTIDAMDLRGFGTQRRTWLRQLAFDRTDRVVLTGFVLLLAVVTVLSFTGRTELWIPDFLVELAG
ncbi:MAG TPA: energy-coupling factor transporter transmembrane component T [Candidatus Limnocylindria bacterium]|jgi:energy-coupling factor transport system permease protein|nr:energy-coupling factor transporter transmembrane component T [Candidatus Limnocylindria bacterium]